jgi:hypothetical protein
VPREIIERRGAPAIKIMSLGWIFEELNLKES